MTNSSESLDLIESAISDCEAEIGKLDCLTADAVARRETVGKLESDLADLHANTSNLEQKVRASRLTSGTALLALERGDLTTSNNQIDNQTDRVIEFNRRATGLLQELHAEVLAERKANIEAVIRRTFNLDKTSVRIELLIAAAHCVIEVEELDATLFPYRSRNERAASVDDARHLRERAAPLIAWAKDLPDLKLAIADPAAMLAA